MLLFLPAGASDPQGHPAGGCGDEGDFGDETTGGGGEAGRNSNDVKCEGGENTDQKCQVSDKEDVLETQYKALSSSLQVALFLASFFHFRPCNIPVRLQT